MGKMMGNRLHLALPCSFDRTYHRIQSKHVAVVLLLLLLVLMVLVELVVVLLVVMLR